MIYIVRKKPHRGLKKSENLPGGGKKEMISRVLESLQLNWTGNEDILEEKTLINPQCCNKLKYTVYAE